VLVVHYIRVQIYFRGPQKLLLSCAVPNRLVVCKLYTVLILYRIVGRKNALADSCMVRSLREAYAAF